ncbi:Trp biosynthesis-associated membrane protein [Herbiconiux sp. CPCC 203407]|uniref:Trp biosynthesis-associated membrane protein n=1 Tax=Herbiconiux oxytropis TaxID=2970915 RepID=A0AA42BT40_9MICO|nr:Trp biosynthesis-associated membrane protein [Herbiconiux oxytropis]MCS5720402.1 Trp biosynthesis-associated membrane protein [Herbiconiux oxytropis]MCS5725975.1 Trp biosynthesis-associated membrane protein [Herbiconiux oxytropis]
MSTAPERTGDGRRLKLLTIVTVLLLSALAFLAWSQPWGSLVLVAADSTSERVLEVPGSVAAPALSALGLAGLALAGALAIAGPVVRIVLGALEVLLGASVLWSGTGALTDPVAAGAAVVTTTTGVAGTSSVRALVEVGEQSPWPAVTVALGALMVVAGLVVIATVRRWPSAGRKYQAVTFQGADGRQSGDLADFFDDDPDAGPPHRTPATTARDAAVDSWDDLTRGTDPTRRAGSAHRETPVDSTSNDDHQTGRDR